MTCSVHLSVCHGRKVLHYILVQARFECSVHIDSHKVYEYIFVNGQLHGLFSAVYLCKMKILTVITPILIFITCVYYSAAWDHMVS